MGGIVELPEVGGLHHRYERRADRLSTHPGRRRVNVDARGLPETCWRLDSATNREFWKPRFATCTLLHSQPTASSLAFTARGCRAGEGPGSDHDRKQAVGSLADGAEICPVPAGGINLAA